MRCTYLLKTVKQVLAKQLTQLPCLVIYTIFQLSYSTTVRIGGRPLQASTSSNSLPGQGAEKASNEFLVVSYGLSLTLISHHGKYTI